MMNVTLYKYYGERNKIDKSNDLTFVMNAVGSFKADVSVLSPTLLLSIPIDPEQELIDGNGDEIDDAIVELANAVDFNYMYIAEFDRYYFITSIVISSNSLRIVSGDVDSLFSFKDQILLNYAMVERNENEFNALLEDSVMPLEPIKTVTETIPTAGTEVNFSFVTDFGDPATAEYQAKRNIVVGLGGHLVDAPNAIPPTDTNLPEVQSARFKGVSTHYYALNPFDAETLLTALRSSDYSSLSTYFNSLIAFPFTLERGDDASSGLVPVTVWKGDGTQVQIEVEGYQVEGPLVNPQSNYKVIADFVLPTPDSFLDLPPYSHYELYIPFYGWWEIPLTNDLVGHRILVYYSINFDDGSGEVYVWDADGYKMLMTAPCQIGVPLAITATNAQEIETQKNASVGNLFLGLTTSVLGIVASALTYNGLGVAAGAMGTVSTIQSFANKNAMMFEKSSSTHNGASGGLYSPLEPRLRVTKTNMVSGLDLGRYAHQFGRPLREVRQLAELTGYTQVTKIHVEGLSATDVEKREIESSLLAGAIL